MVYDQKPMSDNYIQLVRAFPGVIVVDAVQHHEGMINHLVSHLYSSVNIGFWSSTVIASTVIAFVVESPA